MSRYYHNSQVSLGEMCADKIKPVMRPKVEARCYSDRCGRKVKGGYDIKDVRKSAIDCPDCGSVLYWHRERIEISAHEDLDEIIDGDAG